MVLFMGWRGMDARMESIVGGPVVTEGGMYWGGGGGGTFLAWAMAME